MLKPALILFISLISINGFAAFGYNVTPEADALISIHEGAREELNERTSVLIWNVYKEGKKNFKDEFMTYEQKLNPQVTMLQEALLTENLKATCLKESDCYFSEAFKVDQEGFGVLTSSRYPILEAKALHSDELEPLLSTPKTSLITVLQIGDQRIMFINTHGINFVTLYAYEVQLQEIVTQAKDFDGPILWAGDFNSWNPGRNTLLTQAAQDLQLKEGVIENEKLIKKFMGFKLDRVFTRGLKIEKAEALKCHGSDHNPLYIEFSLL